MDKKFEKTSKSFIEEDKTTIKIRLYFIIRFILEHHTTSIRPFVDRFKQIFNENWLVAYLNICMCIVLHQKLSIIQNNIVIAKHNSIIEKKIIMTFTSLVINKLILMKNSWVFEFFLKWLCTSTLQHALWIRLHNVAWNMYHELRDNFMTSRINIHIWYFS
jgi:hypothetical protein